MLLQVETKVEAVGVDVGALREAEHTLETYALLTCRLWRQQQQQRRPMSYMHHGGLVMGCTITCGLPGVLSCSFLVC
jgi:hypothetical protein